ncbi:hypothetical protein HMPREF1529_02145 [Microbacterium sp. oral taxon 186 str. F0373]|nr:hypothetical protein HMPREF1529_02145 [Microbacterium sp. oral taxon 186 str. F0373]
MSSINRSPITCTCTAWSAVHVRTNMNSIAPDITMLDPHEKTIDLRIDRLRKAVAHADAISTDQAPQILHANRTITVLTENRIFVAAHAQSLIEQIVSNTPLPMQDSALVQHVRPLTILIEQANIAAARLRKIIGAHQ